jgi:thiol-disulfide isomerase/thioredoxin
VRSSICPPARCAPRRARPALAFAVAAGLLLAGCTASGRKPAASSTDPSPFLGTGSAGEDRSTPATPASTGPSPPADVDGVLAGQVLDKHHRRPSGAFIQVVDVGEKDSAGKLDVAANAEGYFVIKGLKAGRSYRLIARVKDGDKLLSGTAIAIPPNPRLALYVYEDLTTPATPPLPATPPTKPDAGKDGKDGKDEKSPSAPSAAVAPPVKPGAGVSVEVPAPGTAPPARATAPPAHPELIGREDAAGGFTREPPSPKVNIPGREPVPVPRTPPALVVPPPPESRPSAPAPWPPARSAPPPAGPDAPASAPGPTPVPSCARSGKYLLNFALYRPDGEVWELRKDRKGRLVLLDFWHTTCPPCLAGIKHLNKLQQTYGTYGLEVVGIACESGELAERRQRVNWARMRYGIGYTTLLSGGGAGECPVKKQLEVERVPTLVLVDETGAIVWRCVGMDERTLAELAMQVHRRLGLAGE